MLRIASKNQTRQRVHDRIRKKVMGTPERPRLNVYRSLNHIYVQLIDDLKGETLVAASTADDRKGARVTGGNVASFSFANWFLDALSPWSPEFFMASVILPCPCNTPS